MIIVPVTPQAGAGMVSMMEQYHRLFGRWAIFAWIVTGFIGFALFIVCMNYVTPDLFVQRDPVDGMEIFMAIFMLVIFLLGGPAALPSGPIIAGMVLLFNWLAL